MCVAHLHQEPEPLDARGVKISVELETIVRACLEKTPSRRPQSAIELRRRLEACAVAPWDADRAQTWWLEHRVAVEGTATRNLSEPRTIGVAGRAP